VDRSTYVQLSLGSYHEPGRVWTAKSSMPSLSRATNPSSSRRTTYSAVAAVRKRGPKTRRTGELSLAAPGLDLAARLRVFQRQLRRRLERHDALLDIIRALGTTLEPAEIADLLVERAAGWIPAPSWAVVSSDLSARLQVLAGRGLTPDMGPALHSVANWVMYRGEDFASENLRGDARIRSESVGAVLAFPLACRGRRVGALIGFDRDASAKPPQLSPAVLKALRTLVEPAAAALDSSLLLKRAEALSVTDDLTHLYNSRYLNAILHKETKRASRSGRPVSLLFIDLDGFKSVNDTHGHLSGSRALVEAAAVIRGSARETDVVARFGGDEFAVVLPDTGGEGAFAVGERVRERIAAHNFLARDGLAIRLTASVGLATLPDVAASAEELMAAADKAMYGVKDSGKNGIQAAHAPADN